MKTFAIIETGNATLKNVASNLREGNREYTSLSRVLKDIQRSDLMKKGYREVFEAVGMPTDGKVTPAMFFATLTEEQKGQTYNKKGEAIGDPWYGIWGLKQSVDSEGKKVYEADGKTPVMEAVLRKVTSWTPTRLFKMLAQAQAIKAQAAK